MLVRRWMQKEHSSLLCLNCFTFNCNIHQILFFIQVTSVFPPELFCGKTLSLSYFTLNVVNCCMSRHFRPFRFVAVGLRTALKLGSSVGCSDKSSWVWRHAFFTMGIKTSYITHIAQNKTAWSFISRHLRALVATGFGTRIICTFRLVHLIACMCFETYWRRWRKVSTN
jgi:hypothetical protein